MNQYDPSKQKKQVIAQYLLDGKDSLKKFMDDTISYSKSYRDQIFSQNKILHLLKRADRIADSAEEVIATGEKLEFLGKSRQKSIYSDLFSGNLDSMIPINQQKREPAIQKLKQKSLSHSNSLISQNIQEEILQSESIETCKTQQQQQKQQQFVSYGTERDHLGYILNPQSDFIIQQQQDQQNKALNIPIEKQRISTVVNPSKQNVLIIHNGHHFFDRGTKLKSIRDDQNSILQAITKSMSSPSSDQIKKQQQQVINNINNHLHSSKLIKPTKHKSSIQINKSHSFLKQQEQEYSSQNKSSDTQLNSSVTKQTNQLLEVKKNFRSQSHHLLQLDSSSFTQNTQNNHNQNNNNYTLDHNHNFNQSTNSSHLQSRAPYLSMAMVSPQSTSIQSIQLPSSQSAEGIELKQNAHYESTLNSPFPPLNNNYSKEETQQLEKQEKRRKSCQKEENNKITIKEEDQQQRCPSCLLLEHSQQKSQAQFDELILTQQEQPISINQKDSSPQQQQFVEVNMKQVGGDEDSINLGKFILTKQANKDRNISSPLSNTLSKMSDNNLHHHFKWIMNALDQAQFLQFLKQTKESRFKLPKISIYDKSKYTSHSNPSPGYYNPSLQQIQIHSPATVFDKANTHQFNQLNGAFRTKEFSLKKQQQLQEPQETQQQQQKEEGYEKMFFELMKEIKKEVRQQKLSNKVIQHPMHDLQLKPITHQHILELDKRMNGKILFCKNCLNVIKSILKAETKQKIPQKID